MRKIKSVQMGTEEGFEYFDLYPDRGNRTVDEIREEMKVIGKTHANNVTTGVETLLVYSGYRKGELVFEMEAGSGVLVMYGE